MGVRCRRPAPGLLTCHARDICCITMKCGGLEESVMIILLNGTSSSGKTTVAKKLQERYEGVLLLYGIDTLVQTAFPEKCDYPPYDEQTIRAIFREVDGQPHTALEIMPYMIPIYRTAVEFCRRLSELGYDLIVDEVLFDTRRIAQYFELLSGETVYFIGLKPEKEVVVRRERERGDRIPGLAAGLYDEVYNSLFSYDLTLDTGILAPEESADRIIEYISQNEHPKGFIRSARAWSDHYGKARHAGKE